RQAHADEARGAHEPVEARPGTDGRRDAERKGEAERDQERGARQLERRGVAGRYRPRDRHPLADRTSQLAPGGVGEEARVLEDEGAVETEVVPERRDVRRGRRLAEHDLDRIAGNEMEK